MDIRSFTINVFLDTPDLSDTGNMLEECLTQTLTHHDYCPVTGM